MIIPITPEEDVLKTLTFAQVDALLDALDLSRHYTFTAYEPDTNASCKAIAISGTNIKIFFDRSGKLESIADY